MARNRRLDSGLSGKLERSVCSFTYNAEWPKQKYGKTEKKKHIGVTLEHNRQ